MKGKNRAVFGMWGFEFPHFLVEILRYVPWSFWFEVLSRYLLSLTIEWLGHVRWELLGGQTSSNEPCPWASHQREWRQFWELELLPSRTPSSNPHFLVPFHISSSASFPFQLVLLPYSTSNAHNLWEKWWNIISN